MSFDRIVISANESWLYIDFWPIVSYAWRTIFPEARPTLAFLTERHDDDDFVLQLRRHGDVVLVRPTRTITQAAQAKMARYFVAAKFPDEVCMIDDIDAIPIDRDWHLARTAQRPPGTMLWVGSEVYGAAGGQAPASMMTAEGKIFSKLFAIGELSFPDWLNTLKRGGVEHDNIESPVYNEGIECSTSPVRLGQAMFSDEGLIVSIRKERDVHSTYMRRDYVVGRDTIDRSCLGQFSTENLEAGKYVTAHTGRPYVEHKKLNDQIIDYIRRRYGGKSSQLSLQRVPKIDPDMKFETEQEKSTFEAICKDHKYGSMIVQQGSDHTLTNYLSRYYWVVAIEPRREMLNIYPAYYLFTRSDESVELNHPRIVKRLVNGFTFVPGEKLVIAPVMQSSVLTGEEVESSSTKVPSNVSVNPPPAASSPGEVKDKFHFLRDVGNASHRPLLLLALAATNGDVAEFGVGSSSTVYLHEYCANARRKLFSFENSPEWASKFKKYDGAYHEVKHVDWNDGIGQDREWSVVLIDHNPVERRHHDIAALRDKAKIIVVHDSEDRSPGYMLKKIFPLFKYRCNINMPYPLASATALSNSVDLTSWRGTTFEHFPHKVEP
jgi:hypothetical protein